MLDAARVQRATRTVKKPHGLSPLLLRVHRGATWSAPLHASSLGPVASRTESPSLCQSLAALVSFLFLVINTSVQGALINKSRCQLHTRKVEGQDPLKDGRLLSSRVRQVLVQKISIMVCICMSCFSICSAPAWAFTKNSLTVALPKKRPRYLAVVATFCWRLE